MFHTLLHTTAYITIHSMAPTVPPIQPSIDLFGLTFVNLCFPNFFPVKYANISVPQAAININHINILPLVISLIIGMYIKNITI